MRRISHILATLLIVAVGWLFLTAPSFSVPNTYERLQCQPLGDISDNPRSLIGGPLENVDVIDRYLTSTGSNSEQRIQNSIDEANATAIQICQDLRSNRQTTIVLLLALIILIGIGLCAASVKRSLTNKLPGSAPNTDGEPVT